MARWTDEEICYLAENYKQIEVSEIAKKLNRSKSSVYHRAKIIGLAEVEEHFSEDEDIYLEYFVFEADTKIEEAAKFLKRSQSSVNNRLNLLRKRNKKINYITRRWTLKEDKYLKSNYQQVKAEHIATTLNRTTNAVMKRAKFLGVRKNRKLSSYDTEIRNFAKNGFYCAEAAKSLNISAEALRQYCISNDIKFRHATSEERTAKFRETF